MSRKEQACEELPHVMVSKASVCYCPGLPGWDLGAEEEGRDQLSWPSKEARLCVWGIQDNRAGEEDGQAQKWLREKMS